MSARSLAVLALLAISTSIACTSEAPETAAGDGGDDVTVVTDATTDTTDTPSESGATDVTSDGTIDTARDAATDVRGDTNVIASVADTRVADTQGMDTTAADTTVADSTVADATASDMNASDAPADITVKCDEYPSLELAEWPTGYATASPVVRATMAPLHWKETSAWLVVMANGASASIEGTSTTLGQGANATLAGCTHCVTAEIGCTTTFGETTPEAVDCTAKKTLLAVSGTALFSSVPTGAGQTLAGTLTDVTLREVTASSVVVPGGACIHIGAATVRGTTRAIAEPAARTVSTLFPLLFPNPTAIGGACSLVASNPCGSTPSTPTCTTAPGTSNGLCTTSCGSACTAIGRFCATFATDVCVPPCTPVGECALDFTCTKLASDAGAPSHACTPPGW